MMLSALGDFERAPCVPHAGAEIATFDQSNRQPSPVQYGGNYTQVVTVVTEFIGVEFEALLEQRDRSPIFAEGVMALGETEERLTQHDPVAAFARKADSCLTKLDGTTLLADQEMMIASECAYCALRCLSPRRARMGSSSSRERRIRSVAPSGSRALRSWKRISTARSRLSRVSGNFFRSVKERSKKRTASSFA